MAASYGISVPQVVIAHSPREAGAVAAKLLETSEKVVVKLLSKAISHKSDVGGVILDIETAEAAEEAARLIENRVRRRAPEADIQGYAVQPMVIRKMAQELILGMSRDPIFGPTILFGAGGYAHRRFADQERGDVPALSPRSEVPLVAIWRRCHFDMKRDA